MSEERIVSGSTKSRVRFLLQDLLLYGLATAFVPLMGLIAVPILTHGLTKAEYGAFELVLSYVGVAAIVGGAGQDSTFARFYYDDADVARRSAILRQVIWNQLGAAAVAFVGFLAAGPALFASIASVQRAHALLYAAAFAVPATVALNFVRNVMKWTFLRRPYLVASFGYAALVLLGYGLFVIVLRGGAFGAILSQFIASATVAFGGAMVVRALFLGSHGARFSIPLLKYGAPYVALGVLSQGFRAVDKSILITANGPAAAAAYAVGFKIATIMLIVESTFHIAWGPLSVAIYKEANAEETYNVGLRLLSGVVAVVLLAVAFLSGWLVSVTTPGGYEAAPTIATIVSVGFAAQAVAGVTAVGIELAKRPRLLVVSWAIGVACAVVLMLLLVSRLGAVGVALGAAAGLVIESAARTALAYRVYRVRFDLASGLAPIAASIGVIAIVSRIDSGGVVLARLAATACVASFVAVLLLREWRRLA